MTPHIALAIALGAPVLGALLVLVFSRPPGLRDVIHIGAALASAVAAAFAINAAAHHETGVLVLAQPLPHVALAFSIEPLSALMATVVAGLGFLHAIHTAGMVRATQERIPARLMAMIGVGYTAALGALFSANLFTFFVAYQALTLVTFPQVAHDDDDEARRAARAYLATLLTFSIGLFLPAMVWTYAVSGVLDFRPGGILAGHVDPITCNVLLVLFALGLAMSAIPPGHRWMSVSAHAPHSALVSIQATTLLPVGGVGLLKIAYYVFGPQLRLATYATTGLIIVVGVFGCVAALIALSKQDLRERLAYSCIAQSQAVVMGALLALPEGAFASTLRLVAMSCASATLAMALGNMFAATGWRNVSDTPGLGRLMPWTFAGFAVGAASMIGMPPFAGAWAQLWLIVAAADAGLLWAAVLASAGAVLTFAHLAPLAASALVSRAPTDPFKRPDGASIMLVVPVILCAIATLWLLLLADPLVPYLSPLWTQPK